MTLRRRSKATRSSRSETTGQASSSVGRYQVQIRSTDANFSKFDREDWLKKFDLANLAKLQ